jgi:tetratricopeptide (TPR) repeat protein
LGLAYHDLGCVVRAIEFYEQALAFDRKIGYRQGEANDLSNLGLAYHDLGQVKRAIEFHEQALAINREIRYRQSVANDLGNLGLAYLALGQVERAIEFCEQALGTAREIGYHQGEWYQLDNLGVAHHALGQIEQAIKLYEEALGIAREIGDYQGESYCLLGLGKALLATGELSKARRRCVEALALDVLETSCQATLSLGIVLLHQRDAVAGETFADATARCRALLDKTADLYEPRYSLAAALVGSAVCDPRWAEEGERAGLLAPAIAEYQRALENCAAPGVVRDALRDLEMIRAAGIEGLEPVFELLESAV